VSPWESESWEVISHNAIVVTSGCINKATKYTSHVEKEGEAWSQGIARTRDVKSPRWYGEVAPCYTIWFFSQDAIWIQSKPWSYEWGLGSGIHGILFRMDMPRGPRLGGQGLLEHVSSLQFTTLSSLQAPAPWLDCWSTCNFTFTAVTMIEKRGGLRRDETEDAWYLSAKDTLKINNNASENINTCGCGTYISY